MMWYPAKAAFRVGRVLNENWDNDSIGHYSVAMGRDTKAKGSFSTAMGFSTEATGNYSTALGRDTEATGDYSTALGKYSEATGYSSTAMGEFTEAIGDHSTAMGYNTDATGIKSTAMGTGTDATGAYSTAMGYYTDAESQMSIAIGRYNVGGGNPTNWVETDPLFEIGIGTYSAPANALTVLKNGNVGIGTVSPAGILDIAGAYHFPDIDGTPGQVLQTDGSGTLSWTNKGTTYSVGDFVLGGIVFWLDETGQHGLVCAKQDYATTVMWKTGGNGNNRAYGNGPLAGKMNTCIIIAAQVAIGDGSGTYAARICNELQITEGGKTYGDWYLPSKEEVNLMYQNRTTINATAVANGGSAFEGSQYWSSNEHGKYTAYTLDINTGTQTFDSKETFYWLRAIRAF